MSFITAMILIFAPIKRLAEINVVLQRGIAASESIFNLLDSKSEVEVTDSCTQQSFKADFSNINFNDISFSYYNNDDQVLKDINFKIPREVQSAQSLVNLEVANQL